MNANEYQNKVTYLLRNIFPADLVQPEWNSAVTYGDPAKNRMIYAPRIDIAVGPFNNRFTLDIGDDQTKPMREHPFTKALIDGHYQNVDSLDEIWNKFSRCYLAIEIEFSGSSKHILGDIINAVTNGSLSFLVVNEKNYSKVDRIYKYILRQENQGLFEMNTLKNLIIFKDTIFLELLNDYLTNKN